MSMEMMMRNPYSPYPGNPPGAPSLGMGMPFGGSPAGGKILRRDRLQTMAMIFANPYSTNNMGYGESWTTSEVGCAATIKGANWTVYRNRCYDMGAPYRSFGNSTSAGQDAFVINPVAVGGGGTVGYGEVVQMFAGINFDYIAWGHNPPATWMLAVDEWARKAGRPRPKQGFYFLNFHNRNQAIQLGPLDAELQTIQLDTGGLFESATLAGGCATVDIYQTDGSGPTACSTPHARGTSCTHTWELDYTDSANMGAMAGQMAGVIRDRLDTYWSARMPDFMITDNALNGTYLGTATNGAELDAIPDATYQAMWKQWPAAFRAAIPEVEFWGNHGLSDDTYYNATELPARYGEYGFTTSTSAGSTSASLATLQGRILSAKTLGTKWAVDHGYTGGSVNLWQSSNGPGGGLTWSALKDYSVSVGAYENFIPLACRTSTGFYTHYQPEFALE